MLQFLRTVASLLGDGSHLHDSLVASRLVRAILPKLAVVLSNRSQSGAEGEQASGQGRSKKGRRRARGYEGDEVFKVGREIVCVTAEEGTALLVSLDREVAVLHVTFQATDFGVVSTSTRMPLEPSSGPRASTLDCIQTLARDLRLSPTAPT